MNKIDPAERQRIIDLLHEHGGNRNKVARESKRSPSTIQRIAEQEGIRSNIPKPKNAAEARRDYALAERKSFLNEIFEKARDLLPHIKDPKDLKELVVAVATAIDKRRLEDGEATSRDESHRYDHSAELEDYFRELDSFREENSQVGSRESVDTAEANGKTA